MTAVAIVLALAVGLLGVLVAGLLRSHADILRALHSLGAGIGDPEEGGHVPASNGPVPVHLGPPLPGERLVTTAADVVGTTVGGDAVAVATSTAPATLFAFLSTGCSTCAGFWRALRVPDDVGLPDGVRVVVVTKGPELESPAIVRSLAGPRLEAVMSTQAWIDYEVPGAPFFALVDGHAGRRVGEGLANTMDQVVGLVAQALGDRPLAAAPPRLANGDGPAREADNDAALLAAGIRPGDPSLYPGRAPQ